MTEPIIELAAVRKTYRTGAIEFEALRGVDITIGAGEYVAVVGPSGSGKSTLMHLLGCLDVPTEGSYHLAGEDVSTMSEAQLAHVRNRRVGFVFQQFHLLPSLSAWRNVELPLAYAGLSRHERRERSVEALTRVGLSDRLDHRPGELSGGQQQRVAIARALVGDPALILADEPTGNLDSTMAREIMDILEEINGRGTTLIVVTHNPEHAARAHRQLHIADGRMVDLERIAPFPLNRQASEAAARAH
ncbi:MAG: ABC transporter ATP-binding protein [Thermoanaerobaculia bacterium]